MGKWIERIEGSLKGFLFIATAGQILLGGVWMVCNFPYLREFEATYRLLSVSRDWIADEYTGILYPLLIALTGRIAGLIAVPYYCLLYVLQLGALLFAAHFFFRILFGKQHGGRLGRAQRVLPLWAALTVMTNPFVMLCELSVLPNALALAGLFWQLGLVLRTLRGDGSKRYSPAGNLVLGSVAWLWEALLMPEYLIYGGIPVLFLSLREILRKGEAPGEGSASKGREAGRVLRMALLTGVLISVVPSICSLTVTEGSGGRMRRSPQAIVMRRYTQNCLSLLYIHWPEELKACMTQEDIAECLLSNDRTMEVMGRCVEGTYGPERAREIYGEMAVLGIQKNHREAHREMLWDLAGYTLSPLTDHLFLQGRGAGSVCGRNLDIMRMKTPVLTEDYRRYGAWLFGVSIPVAMLCHLVQWLRGRRQGLRGQEFRGQSRPDARGGCFAFAGCAVLTALVMALGYAMECPGMMDYKSTIYVTALWFVPVCASLSRNPEQNPLF